LLAGPTVSNSLPDHPAVDNRTISVGLEDVSVRWTFEELAH